MCKSNFNPIKCIIPPYIAEKISRVDAPGDGLVVDGNLLAERRFRNKRMALSRLSNARRSAMANIMDAPDPEKMLMEVYDAGQLPILPGELVWQEGDNKTGLDKSTKEVIKGGTNTWEFYKKLFNRNSLDNKGMLLKQSVHYRDNPRKTFDNALWDGSQMIYGDGDGVYYDSFTTDLDIIAHELSHGVIDYEANLTYKDQSGALNESFADVFGILVKQWSNKTTARKANWLIGENIMIGTKYSLRSMKSPGSAYKNHPDIGDDPQPAVMSDYVVTKKDDGGVHYNSGIPNYAFYVAAYELAGNAWEKAGAIWYGALTDRKLMKKSSNFLATRQATIKKATELYGKGSREVKAVTKGWDEAEVK